MASPQSLEIVLRTLSNDRLLIHVKCSKLIDKHLVPGSFVLIDLDETSIFMLMPRLWKEPPSTGALPTLSVYLCEY